jgi:hypothetical protein
MHDDLRTNRDQRRARAISAPARTRVGGDRARSTAVLVGVLVSLLGVGALPRATFADRVDDLCQTMERESDDKARIAAAVSLGRLADQRAVPCLMRALGDKSPVVRGVAASALGYIGDPRAVPALERALKDENEGVRARAGDAIAAIRAKQARSAGEVAATPARSDRPVAVAPKERPLLTEPAISPAVPRVHVTVKSAANKSQRTDKVMSVKLREFLTAELSSSPEVTLDEAQASSQRLPSFVIDGAITDMTVSTTARSVELRCEVRLSIANGKGRMLSVVTGAAVVSVPKSAYRPKDDGALWVTALENAVRGANQDLVAYVTKQVATR